MGGYQVCCVRVCACGVLCTLGMRECQPKDPRGTFRQHTAFSGGGGCGGVSGEGATQSIGFLCSSLHTALGEHGRASGEDM